MSSTFTSCTSSGKAKAQYPLDRVSLCPFPAPRSAPFCFLCLWIWAFQDLTGAESQSLSLCGWLHLARCPPGARECFHSFALPLKTLGVPRHRPWSGGMTAGLRGAPGVAVDLAGCKMPRRLARDYRPCHSHLLWRDICAWNTTNRSTVAKIKSSSLWYSILIKSIH